MKRLLVGLLIGSLVLGVSGCGVTNSKNDSKSTKESNKTEESDNSLSWNFDKDDNDKVRVWCYDGDLGEDVVLPDKSSDGDDVEVTGEGLFKANTDIKSVTVPDTYTEIGREFCMYATNLGSIDFGNEVESLGYYTCTGTALTKLVVPNGVWRIRDYSFSNCEKLESVELPESVTEIGDGCFSLCSDKLVISVPKGSEIISRLNELNDKYISENLSGFTVVER